MFIDESTGNEFLCGIPEIHEAYEKLSELFQKEKGSLYIQTSPQVGLSHMIRHLQEQYDQDVCCLTPALAKIIYKKRLIAEPKLKSETTKQFITILYDLEGLGCKRIRPKFWETHLELNKFVLVSRTPVEDLDEGLIELLEKHSVPQIKIESLSTESKMLIINHYLNSVELVLPSSIVRLLVESLSIDEIKYFVKKCADKIKSLDISAFCESIKTSYSEPKEGVQLTEQVKEMPEIGDVTLEKGKEE